MELCFKPVGVTILMTEYTTRFYKKQLDGSARSAALIAPIILKLIPGIQSAIDVGCGVGTFLAEFASHGVNLTLGVDGDHVERGMLRIAPDQFLARDLGERLKLEQRFDLAISLEVAEHLPAARARSFIADLAALSDVILFSAAIPGQGGTFHLNEQWQDYWAAEFQTIGYRAIDAIRPQIWALDEVEPWYRQNTILYVNSVGLDRNPGLQNLQASALALLRVVHPQTWIGHSGPKQSLRKVWQSIPVLIRKAGARL
jgi:SAM-dependent methyltransferase